MGDKVAFIGLGEMGAPMAGHLARAGFDVAVTNRSPEKAKAWVETHGGRAAPSAAEAVAGAAFVASCVVTDDDVRAVCVGEGGAFAAMDEGSVFVDHSTTSARLARELSADAADRGLGFLDAPVTGAGEGARAGTLAVMAGGAAAAFAKAKPFMDCYAATVVHMGPSGHGQLTKMVNQILISANMEALSEGIFFADETGLDAAKALDAIAAGTASSWWLENRADRMRERDFRTDEGGVDVMVKDLALVLEEARAMSVSLPVTALVGQFWTEMQARGQGRWEAMALITLLGKLGGKTR